MPGWKFLQPITQSNILLSTVPFQLTNFFSLYLYTDTLSVVLSTELRPKTKMWAIAKNENQDQNKYKRKYNSG